MIEIKTGEDLKSARKSLTLGQTKLAKLCGVARNTVLAWEKKDSIAYVTALGLEVILQRYGGNHDES